MTLFYKQLEVWPGMVMTESVILRPRTSATWVHPERSRLYDEDMLNTVARLDGKMGRCERTGLS